MDDDLDELDRDETTEFVEFEPARFSSDLGLPPGDEQQLKDAAAAVRQEFRDSSRWKRLSCKKLAEFGVELSLQKNRSFERKSNTLLATTPHSYKGYESEVVVIPCVDHYVAPEGKLVANGLYVAMTRARSLLAMYGINSGSEASRRNSSTIASCVEIQQVAARFDYGDQE